MLCSGEVAARKSVACAWVEVTNGTGVVVSGVTADVEGNCDVGDSVFLDDVVEAEVTKGIDKEVSGREVGREVIVIGMADVVTF